jgi:hypothetical protein
MAGLFVVVCLPLQTWFQRKLPVTRCGIATGKADMAPYLRITISVAYLLICLGGYPSYALNGGKMKVSLSGVVVTMRTISKADAAILTDRFQTELKRSSAFEVVAATDADLVIAARVSRQDTTYIVKMEVRTLKTGKNVTMEAHYSAFTDLISDFTRGLPGLVSNRLEPAARNLLQKDGMTSANGKN